MVLFKEDEKRIKEMEKAEKLAKRGKLERVIRRCLKIGMVLGALFVISLGILAALGGKSDSLKNGIEDYLGQAMGMQAQIKDFNHMGFFPKLELDAGGIAFRKKEGDAADITVDQAKFSAGFFDLMLSRQRFSAINVENLRAAAGVFGDKALHVTRLGVKEEEGKEPLLFMTGTYGAEPITLELSLGRDGSSYRLPKSSNFKLNFGEFKIIGQTESVSWGGVKLTIEELGTKDFVVNGDVTFKKKMSSSHVDIDLNFGDSEIEADLEIAKNRLSGAVTFPVLALKDISALQRIHTMLDQALMHQGEGVIDFYDWDADIDVDVESFTVDGKSLGKTNVNVSVKDQVLRKKISGRFNGGDLKGTVTLDAKSLPAKMKIDADLKDWDYGAYQLAMMGKENLSGTANIKFSATSEGKSYDDLLGALNGEAVFIAGKGKLASKTLNVWGAGLANAMLPNLSGDDYLTLNCMIADFKIEDGIAKPSPFFMDTVRVTVVGDGEINLPENKLDLKFDPKAKGPAFMDVATAVRVSGTLQEPQVGTDTFSLFEKIGGLALGLVNPAVLVFSMTDLGLTENHPCYEFIEKPAEVEEKAETPESAAAPAEKPEGAVNE